MDRKKRAIKRSAKSKKLPGYKKRKMTKDTVCHYILYPVVPSTIGKSNDFYLHTLRLIWNDRNILKDSQCKKLFQGLYLKAEEIDNLGIEKLTRDKENGWFTSSRQSDLATIGKVAGYFLRRFTPSLVKALDKRFSPDTDTFTRAKNLDDLFEELRDNQTIIPVIVKLDISPHSNFDHSKFIYLTEDVVKILCNGEKIPISRRAELLKINTAFHKRTWDLMNPLENETRQKIIEELIDNETVHLPQDRIDIENQTDDENLLDGVPIDALEPLIELTEGPLDAHPPVKTKNRQIERRPASSRLKEKSKKYPFELYDME